MLDNNFDLSMVVLVFFEKDVDKVYVLENNMKEFKDMLDSMKDCDVLDCSIKFY